MAHLTFSILLLLLEGFTVQQPGSMALLLAGKPGLLLLLLPLHRCHRVQELLVPPALLYLLLILVQLAADGGHGGVQPLDLHQLQALQQLLSKDLELSKAGRRMLTIPVLGMMGM